MSLQIALSQLLNPLIKPAVNTLSILLDVIVSLFMLALKLRLITLVFCLATSFHFFTFRREFVNLFLVLRMKSV